MIENRFQYNVNKNTIEQDGKFVAYVSSVGGVIIANKLNVFQKENEQLQKDCTALIYHNQEYRKENEELKSDLRYWRTLAQSLAKKNNVCDFK